MSKVVFKRPPPSVPTVETLLRDAYLPLSEYLKELLHQACLKAKEEAVRFTQTIVAEQEGEMAAVQRAVSEAREKIKRVTEERDQVVNAKEALAVELEKSMKVIDYSAQRKTLALAERNIAQRKGELARLRSQVENLRDEFETKGTLLQVRENEVRLMKKELEKSALQRSLLLGRIHSDKPPAKTAVKLASKSQADTLKRDSLTRGIQKDTIKPFTSFSFSLNMFQGGMFKVPSGLNTSRSSNSKGNSTPSSQRRPTDSKASSPSVE